VIKWDWPTEFVQLHLGKKRYRKGEFIETCERWPDLPYDLVYAARVEEHKIADKQHYLRLIYERENNDDAGVINKAWGYSELKIDLEAGTVIAQWINDAPYEYYSGLGEAALVSEALLADIEYECIRRIKRQQAKFRNQLLKRYKKCVLTGESCPELLDAAHIIDMQDGGANGMMNGILLRTDLHRLFDRRLLIIREDGSVNILPQAKVLGEYRDYVESLNVKPDVLKGIKSKLHIRNSKKFSK
jgi:predicted restriction endonuclease